MPWHELAKPGSGWNIPSGGVLSPQTPYLVRWLDYRGNVVRQQYAAAGQTFSHPAAPVFAGLDFWGWSGSAALVTSDIDIVGVWTPTDGKRHIFVESSSLAGTLPVLKFAKTDTSTLLIEWGDGTTTENSSAGNVTITKPAAYAVDGAHEIKVSISVGTGTASGGFGTTGNPMLSGVAVTEYWGSPDVVAVAAYAFNGPAFRTFRYATGFTHCTSFGVYGVYNCYSLVSLSLPSCTSFGTSGAQGCSSLVSLSLPSCTSLGAYGAQSCYSLVSLSLPSCTSFGGSGAQNCSSLVSLSLPSCTSFGASGAQSCRNLVDVVIGPNCSTMDALCLDGCRELRALRVKATIPPTLASVASIADFDPRMLIYVPTASVTAYKTATNWSAFASRIMGY